ncbi:hypothetical protein Tco_1193204 [Tanacetum coccineum]
MTSPVRSSPSAICSTGLGCLCLKPRSRVLYPQLLVGALARSTRMSVRMWGNSSESRRSNLVGRLAPIAMLMPDIKVFRYAGREVFNETTWDVIYVLRSQFTLRHHVLLSVVFWIDLWLPVSPLTLDPLDESDGLVF